MARYICPLCGSKYFLSSKTGPKNVFQVGYERVIEIIQMAEKSFTERDMDTGHIFCGACSWQGSLDELVVSNMD